MDQVWALLTNFDMYADWHPHIISPHADLRPGGQITVSAAAAGEMSLDAKILDVEARSPAGVRRW